MPAQRRELAVDAVGRVGGAECFDARQRRAHHLQQALGWQFVEVFKLQRQLHFNRQARHVHAPLGFQNAADLVPRGVHVIVLVLAHHLGAIACRTPVARAHVQVGQPVFALLIRLHRLLFGVPTAQHLRLHFQACAFVVQARVCHWVGRLASGRVDDGPQALRLCVVRFAARFVLDRHQGAFHGFQWHGLDAVQHAVHAHRRRANLAQAGGQRRASVGAGCFQTPRQRLKVARHAGGKFPPVIDR